MSANRFLTKSRFKLALECPTKLFYTGKKSEYTDQKLDDSFLLALADGGFQVGELAKCYVPGGHDVVTLDHALALAETNEYLKQEQVTIYEAAIATEKLFIRADVLVKDGNRLWLYEVKAKSIDPAKEDPFNNKNGTLKSSWMPYLYDVAFQKYVISQALPEYTVLSYLMLADKSAYCPTDGLNQKFRLIKELDGRKSVEVSKELSDKDLSAPLLVKVNVDAHCEQIYAGTDSKHGGAISFTERVNLYADHYVDDIKIPTRISVACGSCEFHSEDRDCQTVLKSGRDECWKAELGWTDEELKCPTVLDVWNFRRKSQLLDSGVIKLTDLCEEDVTPKADNKPGLSASERQWLQVQKCQCGDNEVYIEREHLQREMDSWVYPLHFIDFETTMVAIPFHAGHRPYEQLAFQFSHHTVQEDGTVSHAGEYLNMKQGAFPNYDFVRALRSQLEHDNGSVFRYSNHENTVLNQIYRQLQSDERDIPGRKNLGEFIRSITSPTKDIANPWESDRSMIDLLDLVKRYYYDPATNGSNSLKHVLPAILNSSCFLQEKYSEPIYGADAGIRSLNFQNWTWIELEEGKVKDPYKQLPTMFQDISNKDMEFLSHDDKMRDGGAALTAYARMQFEEMSDYERDEIRKALLKYCELDTLAMVMVYEGWRDMLRR
jgi:hypothetical protein